MHCGRFIWKLFLIAWERKGKEREGKACLDWLGLDSLLPLCFATEGDNEEEGSRIDCWGGGDWLVI